MNSSDKIITSTANPLVKKLRSLAAKKGRDEEKLFLVEGLRHVNEALATGWQPEIMAFSARARKDMAAPQKRGCQYVEVTDDILSKITQRDNAQSVVAAFRPQWSKLDDVQGGLWVGLEDIRDPGNLGTIMRTADAVGAEGVLLVGDACDPWSPEAIRGSMGSFARIKVAYANRTELLTWRKKNWRGKMVGTHLQTENDYRSVKYELPLLLMMGSEQSGLSADITKACDAIVKIPMAGGTESLNLAVSTGVMLYEVFRDKL